MLLLAALCCCCLVGVYPGWAVFLKRLNCPLFFVFVCFFTFAQAIESQKDAQNAVAEVEHLRSQNALLEETLAEVFIDENT